MEVILDELKKNYIYIDMKTLSHHINYFLEHYTFVSGEHCKISRFRVNNFGRAMSYLTFVYMVNAPEEVIRDATRLVTIVLKTIDFDRFIIRDGFFSKIVARIKRTFLL